MPDDSTRTVLVALGAGLGVALAKIGAAVFTGSSAMAAEASHSLSDTANDLFLFVAQRRSTRHPDDRHPLGYGREAYFWALIAALGVFVAGAAFSLREGITELIHPGVTSSFTVAYVVLALNQLTGSSIPQGIAAVLIGLLLIRTSLRLGKRSHDFLVGAWLLPSATSPRQDAGDDFTRPLRSADEDRVRAFLRDYPGVIAIREVLVTFTGPGRAWVTARLDIDDELTGAQVKSLVRGIESGMKRESEVRLPGRYRAHRRSVRLGRPGQDRSNCSRILREPSLRRSAT